MDKPAKPNLDYDFAYLMENPDDEVLYAMKDESGQIHGVPRGRVEYALSRGIAFRNGEDSDLYWRENKDAPSVERRKIALLEAVKESLEHEQRLRNQKAADHGWPIHPNDVEGLTPEQQRSMLDAWRERRPPPDFL